MPKARKEWDLNGGSLLVDKFGEWAHFGWSAGKTVNQENRDRVAPFQSKWKVLLPLERSEIDSALLIHSSLFSIIATQRYNGATSRQLYHQPATGE
ncbi:MAG: hypothetical protein RIR52_1290 [Acidobacteriota bacterium]|jgi:hypothetical protein